MKKFAGLLLFVGMGVFATSVTAQAAIVIDNKAPRDAAISAPLISPAPSPKYESVAYGFTHMTYRTKRGDNITDIARRHSSDAYKISVDELLQLNNIKNPNRILIGQKLHLPVYYAKEMRVIIPVMVQAAVEAAVVQKEAELTKTKWLESAAIAIMLLSVALFIFCALTIRSHKTKETEGPLSDSAKRSFTKEKKQ